MKKNIAFLFLFFLCSFSFAQKNNFIIAENYFRNNEFKKAIQLYKGLYKKSPYNTTYLKRLVTCYQETNQFSLVENLVTEKIKRFPKQTFLLVVLGHNFERQQLSEKADEYYKKALETIKSNRGYGSVTANLFKEYNKLDYAIEAYTGVMEQNPKANFGFQLAQIYGEKGDFEKMFESYVDLVDKNENFVNNVKRYANRYITEEPENENNILFKRALLKKSISKPKNIWNNLLAWLFIKQKQYQKALIQYKALLARNADHLSSVKELGKIAYDNLDYETAKDCFNLVIEKTNYESDKFHAIYMNLIIDIANKEQNLDAKFREVFEQFGTNRKTIYIQLAYADFLTFQRSNPEKAILVLEKALKLAGSKFAKASVKLKLGEVLVFTRKFNKALIYFSQVQTKFKNHELAQEARFKVAQTSYFNSDFTWAKAQLKILKGSATQLIANDATELFLTISDNQPSDSIPSGLKEYAKADLLAYQNKNDAAIAILSEVISNFKNQPIEDEALFKQAELYVKKENFTEAISNFEKVLLLNPEGVLIDNSLYALAELYNTKLNNPKKASEYYQKIIFDHASSIYLVDSRRKYRKLRGDDI
ncbi:Tetratricopeptide repeat-containing protein [Tenacibaculum sp. MAR_2009_124]|uniref:tetratricopeptide repeat protein n=1 Tax=Tenacibaculum sp. MAR_2009_124 TaxID=1250059 RepID=UPI000899308B|nr:tetratricopeptide repeat protein [Tenacibaculum sp. MAR_2009_124]SEC34672.1 Tetratricopeptide repeat-containing protein [Tenacibaculum sp. MAR_2009_124]